MESAQDQVIDLIVFFCFILVVYTVAKYFYLVGFSFSYLLILIVAWVVTFLIKSTRTS